jgi:hypothetical protein
MDAVHAICESNYSRSLISFRFPARCVLSRDKFSPIPQLLETEGAGRSFSFFSHSRCGARVVPEGPYPRPSAFVGVLYFLAAVAADAAHLHGAISYVLRRPITRVDSGSDRKPSRGPAVAGPNRTSHAGIRRGRARPAFSPFGDTLRARTLTRRCPICCRGQWARQGPQRKG